MKLQHLTTFEVQAWLKPADGNGERSPMKITRIAATTGKQAAVVYASCNQMPRSFWDNGLKEPVILIKVKKLGLVENGQWMDARLYK